MVILEPDGTVNHDGYGAHPHPLDLLTKLAAGGEALSHGMHYSFDVPGIGKVALQLDGEMVAAVNHPQCFTFVRIARS